MKEDTGSAPLYISLNRSNKRESLKKLARIPVTWIQSNSKFSLINLKPNKKGHPLKNSLSITI
ncbi:hypothetical protein GCM10016272_00050 [Psychrobacter glaciei]|uniref:Uncharacterized protein n=1 Tax=Psychrobacter glaciei TaxID=619771 RepID=A0ABQ3GL94_9GAMM|nr:hypothetical protein GCM10016272_00050 [Psychrobacter glaciei]